MARLTIYLTGHGGWTVKNGYSKVPKGCTFTFYTQNAKLMLAGDVYKIIKGTFTGEPDMEVGALHSVQNMSLYKDDAPCIPPTEAAVKQALAGGRWVFAFYANKMNGGATMTLDQVFAICSPWMDKYSASYQKCDGIDYVWTCCRDLSLNPSAKPLMLGSGTIVPGSDIGTQGGVNAAQTMTGTGSTRFMQFDKSKWQLGGDVVLKLPPTL